MNESLKKSNFNNSNLEKKETDLQQILKSVSDLSRQIVLKQEQKNK